MKCFIVLALVAAVAADVPHLRQVRGGPEADAQVLRQDSEVLPDHYQYAYETSNGISGQESGQLKTVGQEAAITVQGSSQYQSPEGEQVSLQYVADENGYQPQGSHLPVPPPTPEAILRSLEYIRTHPAAPEGPSSVFQRKY